MVWKTEILKVTKQEKIEKNEEIKTIIKNRVNFYKQKYKDTHPNIQVLILTSFKGEIVPVYRFKFSDTVSTRDTFMELRIEIQEIEDEENINN